MRKIRDIQSSGMDEKYLYLKVDGRSYRIAWSECSSMLAKASIVEREYMEISPSGYGLHWPLLDEDLAITPLLQQAEPWIRAPVLGNVG